MAACLELITEKIAPVKENNYYSILIDEATDCEMKGERTNSSNLRFVDKDNIIREKFVNFLECKNALTGAGL